MKTCSRCSILIAEDAQLCPECKAALEKKNNDAIRKITGTVAAIALFADVIFTVIIILNNDKTFPAYYGTVTIISGLLAGMLLFTRKPVIVDIVRILIIVTGIILTMLLSSLEDISGPLLHVLFTAALVSLITGVPGKIRISISSAAAAIYLLSALVLVQESFPGTAISGNGNKSVHRSRSPRKKKKKRHKAARVSLPHRKWKKTEGDQAKEKHPKALQWCNYPEFDAQVLILMDSVARPDTINDRMYLDSVLTYARTTINGFMIIDRSPCSNKDGLKGTSIIAHGTAGGKGVFQQYAFFPDDNYIYQIFCVSNEETFNQVKKDFAKIIHSFKP